jgi:hypothetical protein
VHRLSRELLRKRYRHRTSTKFRLGLIRQVQELFKWPSYYYMPCLKLEMLVDFIRKIKKKGQKNAYKARLKVFTAMKIRVVFSWVLTLCSDMVDTTSTA